MKSFICFIFGHDWITNYFIGYEYTDWDRMCSRCGKLKNTNE